MTEATATTPTPFLTTKEAKRFTEFCDGVRRHRYIGLCYGPPGVGKTLSARHYAGWDNVEPYLHNPNSAQDDAPPEAMTARTVFYTPKVTSTPRRLEDELDTRCLHLDWAIEETLIRYHNGDRSLRFTDQSHYPHLQLLIVDEADRLKTAGLEQLRDFHDRTGIGLALIGMPGLERRLARYAQLYSRIGFAHEYRPLSADELAFVLTRHWKALGLGLCPDDFTDAEALAAIARITHGNFRLVQRLFNQIMRIMEINELNVITKEVVDTARESLVIGFA